MIVYSGIMDINSFVWKDGILFSHAATKADALEQIIARASKHPSVSSPKALAEGIYNRERIISTGIGLGVAIPHAKIGGISEFFICVSVLDQGVDWDAVDEEPVRIIFLIAGPESQQNQYLQLLARLSLTIKNPAKRAAIMNSHGAEELIAQLAQP
jgi:PTS system nitrogen regulatory IIA component